jgi:hypothetical protein
LPLALNNVPKDSSNSSTLWFKPVSDALGDEDDLDIESDKASFIENTKNKISCSCFFLMLNFVKYFNAMFHVQVSIF